MKPRRVIIVRGAMSGCEAMEKVANKVTSEVGVESNKKVFLPKTGELVKANPQFF